MKRLFMLILLLIIAMSAHAGEVFYPSIYNSDFSADADSWTAGGGAVAGNIDVGGQTDCLRLTINNLAIYHYIYRSVAINQYKRYNFSFDYYLPSTNSHLDNIVIRNAGVVSSAYNVTNTWTSVTYNIVADVANGPYIHGRDGASLTIEDAGGNDVFYIRNFRMENSVLN